MKRLILIALLFATPAWAAEPGPIYKPIKMHMLPYSAASVALTSETGSFVKHVSLLCTTACYYAIGSTSTTGITSDTVAIAQTPSDTATTSFYLPAGVQRDILVPPSTVVAVIKVSTNGILYVIEQTR